MTKTWETLFNLSSFMKYLLTEVLPHENVESPWYVIESLHELLQATLECIRTIKNTKPENNYPHLMKNQVEKCTDVVLSPKYTTREIVKPFAADDSDRTRQMNKDNASNLTNLEQSSQLSNDEKTWSHLMKVEINSKTVYINKKFNRLNNEMHAGAQCGYYCSACESVFYAENDWIKHCNSDQTHILATKRNSDSTYMSCNYCNLVLFGPSRTTEDYVNFHIINHLENGNNKRFFPILDETRSNQQLPVIFLENRQNQLQTPVTNCRDVKMNLPNRYPKQPLSRISANFIELDRIVHSRKQKAFYCSVCDEEFYSNETWRRHFQPNVLHDSQNVCQLLSLCNICSFEIFVDPLSFTIYSFYHKKGHSNSNAICSPKGSVAVPKIKPNSNADNFKNSPVNVEESSIKREKKNINKFCGNKKSTVDIANERTSKNYITSTFQLLNFLKHLNIGFYCRPCDEACKTKEEWKKHFDGKKHKRIFSNRNFKNCEGKCNYCGLVIVGLEVTIQEYMEYHTIHDEDHHKGSSYQLKPLEIVKKRGERLTNKNSIETNSYSEANDSIIENAESLKANVEPFLKSSDELNTICKNQDSNEMRNYNENEKKDSTTSWYSLSSEEELKNTFLSLIRERKAANSNTSLSFFGICFRCGLKIENGFDWQDHLISSDHCQRANSNDFEHSLSAISLSLFGSDQMITKYKNLAYGIV